jgi:hypothetical protein
MGRYVVFAIDDNEDAWADASEETKQVTYDADLGHSRTTRLLRKGPDDAALVTEGPHKH